jgi:hypothetical protein
MFLVLKTVVLFVLSRIKDCFVTRDWGRGGHFFARTRSHDLDVADLLLTRLECWPNLYRYSDNKPPLVLWNFWVRHRALTFVKFAIAVQLIQFP